MTKTIELSGGKVIDLNRFVALLPYEKAENRQYHLILEGCDQTIVLDSQEATLIKEHLKLNSKQNGNGKWDREKQIIKNQPKLKKLREWIDQKKQESPSPEKDAAFEAFKQTIDAERPIGQKLYEH